MTLIRNLLFLVLGSIAVTASGQKKFVPVDLYTLAQNHQLQPVGREPTAFSEQGKKGVRFLEKENDGLAWMHGLTFSNGTIELDIKSRDVPQQSFVGKSCLGRRFCQFNNRGRVT